MIDEDASLQIESNKQGHGLGSRATVEPPLVPNRVVTRCAQTMMSAYNHCIPLEEKDANTITRRTCRAQSGNRYHLDTIACDAIAKAASHLIPALGSYPLEVAVKALTGIVVEAVDTGVARPQAQAHFHEHTLRLIMRSAPSNRWRVIWTVQGIDSRCLPHQVGRFELYQMDQRRRSLWMRRMRTGMDLPPDSTPVDRNTSITVDRLKNQVVVESILAAADQQHATAVGRADVEELLNVIRYGQLAVGFYDHPTPEVGLAKQGDLHHGTLAVCIDRIDFGLSESGGGPEGAMLEHCQRAPAWERIVSLLDIDRRTRTEVQRRITMAIQWVGIAAGSSVNSVRLISLMTALEAMLILRDESRGKKKKLAHRLPSLVNRFGHQVNGSEVEAAYRERSACVHGAQLDVELAAYLRVVRWVSLTIDALLSPPFFQAKSLEEVLRLC